MFSRPYSRKLEAEADKVGLQLAAKVLSYPVYYFLNGTKLILYMKFILFAGGIATQPAKCMTFV